MHWQSVHEKEEFFSTHGHTELWDEIKKDLLVDSSSIGLCWNKTHEWADCNYGSPVWNLDVCRIDWEMLVDTAPGSLHDGLLAEHDLV